MLPRSHMTAMRPKTGASLHFQETPLDVETSH
jgi:hypothetical protein